MTKMENCPACGALPCDWVFNPRTDHESKLVEAQKALDSLALALTAHNHVWTPEERADYERATLCAAE